MENDRADAGRDGRTFRFDLIFVPQFFIPGRFFPSPPPVQKTTDRVESKSVYVKKHRHTYPQAHGVPRHLYEEDQHD